MAKYAKLDTMNVELIVGGVGCALALLALIVASMAKGGSSDAQKVAAKVLADVKEIKSDTTKKLDEFKRQRTSFQEEIGRKQEKVDEYAKEFNELRGEIQKLVAKIADARDRANKHTNTQNARTTERLDQGLGELSAQLRLVENALAKLDEDIKPRAMQVIREQLRRRGLE